jgi:hypothetical protein
VNAWDLLPLVRELFSRLAEHRHHEPWELQSLLWSPGYTDELLHEWEIARADQKTRNHFYPMTVA